MRNYKPMIFSMLVAACGGPLDEVEATQDDVHALSGKVKAKQKDKPKNTAKPAVETPVQAKHTLVAAQSLNPLVVKTSFAPLTSRDIFLVGSVSGLSGTHEATFEIFSPGSAPYQTMTVSFSGSAPSVALPVMGTFITQFSLYGTWSVSMFLDGSGTAAATTTFTIQP